MAKANDLKKENVFLVKECLYDGKIWTKNEVSEKTGLSIAGARNVLRYLTETGDIYLCGLADSVKGRKSKQYIIAAEKHYIGRIIISRKEDGLQIMCSSVTLLKDTVAEFTEKYEQITEKEIRASAEKLLKESGKLSVIAVSIPGVCISGTVEWCGIASLKGVNIQGVISQISDIPVVVENDVNVACIGFHSMYEYANDIALIYQTAAGNYGCGLILGGRLYNGSRHYAGEISCVPLITESGKPPCAVLEDQIMMICCAVNPLMVAWYSEQFADEVPQLEGRLPESLLPELHQIRDFTGTVSNGLFSIGKLKLLEKEREGS